MNGRLPALVDVGDSITASLRASRQEIAELLSHLNEDIVEVPIAALRPADSPRLGKLDAQHAQMLAETDELSPIIVHRATMRVIDGMHRVFAAQLAGCETIQARFFDGGGDEAFLLAVDANTAHGLPLTLTERRAAAERIVRSRPYMSDRSIASIAGLAAKTVAIIRRQVVGTEPPSTVRIGRDGRSRPLNTTNGRRIAAAMVNAQPDVSLRTIAKEAGISVGTARDVRERIRRGEDPTLAGPAAKNHAEADLSIRGRSTNGRTVSEPPDPRLMLECLSRDPTLRYVESGRFVLRWLAPRVIASDEWEGVVREIPPHATFMLAKIARACAAAWSRFANELDRRAEDAADV